MRNKLITYKTFDTPIQANLIKSKLEAYGIEAYVFDENLITLNQFYNLAAGGIKLKIKDCDIERVHEILKEEDHLVENEVSEITCPNCGSGNVAFGPATKRKFSIGHILLTFLVLAYPFPIRYRYHCFNCGHEFKQNLKKTS